ncbi:MAG: response regulator, partial [Rhodoferax sp.]|nr:response regulator [Rhodoferax sp.]
MTDTLQNRCAPSVLVVDDDEFAREVLGEMLNQLGVKEILTANDGRVALRVLSSLDPAPNFVICDVFMPDMDGTEFLDHLATRGYSGGIIMLSGVDAN